MDVLVLLGMYSNGRFNCCRYVYSVSPPNLNHFKSKIKFFIVKKKPWKRFYFIGAGAKVLGPINIGSNAKVGANAAWKRFYFFIIAKLFDTIVTFSLFSNIIIFFEIMVK